MKCKAFWIFYLCRERNHTSVFRIVNVVSDKIIILPEELIKSTPRTIKDLQHFFKGEHTPPRYRDLNLVATRIRDRTKLLVNNEKEVVNRTKNHELVKIIKEATKSAKDAETKLSHLIKKMAKVGSHEWRGGCKLFYQPNGNMTFQIGI